MRVQKLNAFTMDTMESAPIYLKWEVTKFARGIQFRLAEQKLGIPIAVQVVICMFRIVQNTGSDQVLIDEFTESDLIWD